MRRAAMRPARSFCQTLDQLPHACHALAGGLGTMARPRDPAPMCCGLELTCAMTTVSGQAWVARVRVDAAPPVDSAFELVYKVTSPPLRVAQELRFSDAQQALNEACEPFRRVMRQFPLHPEGAVEFTLTTITVDGPVVIAHHLTRQLEDHGGYGPHWAMEDISAHLPPLIASVMWHSPSMMQLD
jgi:hypothetical protein